MERTASVKATLEVIIVVSVMTVSLGLRLVGLDAFVVNDEMRWTCRSIGFQEALIKGEWASTFRTGHPGVVTTWLGAIFIPYETADVEAREACQITPDASELSESGDTPEERTDLMHKIRDLLFMARRGVALFTWVSLVGIYLLTRHLWGVEVALLSLVLMAADPFYLALSRILHVDGVLTSVMTLSVLGLVASLRHCTRTSRRIGFLGLSGAMAGLAVLQKSPAGFLGPFAVLLVGIDVLRKGIDRRSLLEAIWTLFIWGLVAAVVYVALWPTMWVQPVETMRRVLEMALGYAAEGHSSGNYFMGRPNEDPGWLFYPVATPFRLSPLALIGVVAGLVWLISGRGDKEERRSTSDLLIYGMAFGVFMTLGNKMFDRYLVPVYPSLEIVAALGLWWMAGAARDRLRGVFNLALSVAPIAAIALAVQLLTTLPHYPHYLTYYNPLLGGIRQAKKILLVGWGEGYEQAAAYLNDKPNAEELEVIMPAFPVFAPQFDGSTRSVEKYSIWGSDYVMFYLSHVQRQRYEDLMLRYLYNPVVEPERVFALHGVDYIWLYHNDHYLAPIQYLNEHAQPEQGECVLVNGDSLFAKYYQGELPLLTFGSHYDAEERSYMFWTRDQVANLLDHVPPSCRKLWYVRYPVEEDEDYFRLLYRRSVELDRATFPDVEVTLHRLVGSAMEQQVVDLQFGSLLLHSFGQTDPPAAWGRDGGLVLEWEGLRPLEEDYSVFLHLYNSHGHRIAQGDALITSKSLEPTSQWEPGSKSLAVYHLPIPAETPAGGYELALGVYLLETGERLPLLDGEGATQDKSATLGITVGVPDRPPDAADLPVSNLLQHDLVPQLRLLGYSLEHEEVLAGEGVPVRLFWRALSAMDTDYRLKIDLRGGDGTVYVSERYGLVTTDHPTSEWQRGETLGEWYYLPTEEDLPTGDMSLEVNLLDEKGRPVLAHPAHLTTVWVQSRRPSFEVPEVIGERTRATLGDRISLLGYDVKPLAKPGQDLEVTITWQALQEMSRNYKVFVHLYDDQGGILGQRDRIPGLGARPTTTWELGEVLVDRYSVPVPDDAPAGTYPLAVGLYDPETGQRLMASDPDGRLLEQNRVSLGEVEVRP